MLRIAFDQVNLIKGDTLWLELTRVVSRSAWLPWQSRQKHSPVHDSFRVRSTLKSVQ